MQVTFPHLALSGAAEFRMIGQSLEAAESITGIDTTVPTMQGRWVATVDFLIKGEAAALQWLGFLAQMEGRVGATLVPARQRFRPRDRDGKMLPFQTIAGIESAQTMEHFGFQAAPINQVVVNLSAPLRATEIEVRYNNTTGLRPGHLFSIGERLHRVQYAYQSRLTETGAPRYAVHFQPPLREAVAAGTLAEVQRPVCKMQMMNEEQGLMDQVMARMPKVQVQFREII